MWLKYVQNEFLLICDHGDILRFLSGVLFFNLGYPMLDRTLRSFCKMKIYLSKIRETNFNSCALN